MRCTAESGTVKNYDVIMRAECDNNQLSTLTENIASSSFSPAFSPSLTGLALSALFTETTVRFTPTQGHATQVIRVDGVITTSGTQSAALSLSVGSNTIPVNVVAENGASKTYVITVTRAAAETNNNAASLNQVTSFNPATTSYSVTLPAGGAAVTLTGTCAGTYATRTYPSGGQNADPTECSGNVVRTMVCDPQDTGTAVKTYTVTFTRACYTQNDLSALVPDSGSLSPGFSSGTTVYTVNPALPFTDSNIRFTPTGTHATMTITVNGVGVASGAQSGNVALTPGSNTVNVVGTAQSGATKTYTVTVTRTPAETNNNAATLSHVTGFTAGTTSYSVTLPAGGAAITMTGTCAGAFATQTYPSGQSAHPTGCSGNVVLSMSCDPQDTGTATKTYTVTFTRACSTVSTLNALVPDAGSLSPGFASGTLTYTMTLPYSDSDVRFTPTGTHTTTTITVNGVGVGSGAQSGQIALSPGSNTVTVIGTAQDGSTTSTYTVTVTRTPAETNNNAASLNQVSGFNPATTSYSVTLPAGGAAVTLTGTCAGTFATQTYPSGGQTADPTACGGNVVRSMACDPEDPGTAIKTYTVTFTRSCYAISTLNALVPDAGSLSPGFASGTLSYTLTLPFTDGDVRFTPTGSHATTTITVNGAGVGSGVQSGQIALSPGSNTVTVIGTAQDGSTTSTYTVTVTRTPAETNNNAATLNQVTGFNPATTSYSVTLPAAGAAVTLSGTCAGTFATQTYPSGGQTADPTACGGNVVRSMACDPQDAGTATKTYTVTFTRSCFAISTLNALVPDAGSLSPVFASGTLSYTMTLPYVDGDVRFTPTGSHATTSITVNGVGVASGAQSGQIALSPGSNTVTVIGTAQDGSTTSTYTVTVTRTPPSTNTNLASLSPSTGAISPAFASGTTVYTMTIPFAAPAVVLTATVADSLCSRAFSGGNSYNPAGGASVAASVTVTAESGATKVYQVTINRVAASTNANLAGLVPTGHTFAPAFDASVTLYTSAVPFSTTSVQLQPTADDAALHQGITVDGVAVTSGSTSGAIALAQGANSIDVVVTAESGAIKTYTVSITRQPSTDAQLSMLSVSSGTLSPAFAMGTTVYTLTGPIPWSSNLQVTPTANAAPNHAGITVDGAAVGSGAPSAPLHPGASGTYTVSVVCTAGDAVTKITYTLTFTRSTDVDANLSGLVTSVGTLAPPFSAAVTAYTATVAYGVTSAQVTPTASSPVHSALTVEGGAVASGSLSPSVALSVGSGVGNEVDIVVTAEDGTTTKTYKVTYTRSPSTDARLSSLVVPQATSWSPVFDPNTQAGYVVLVSAATGKVSFTPTAFNIDHQLIEVLPGPDTVASGVMSNPYTVNVGDNAFSVRCTAQSGATANYAVTVRRLDNDAGLTSLTVSAGTLTPPFASGTFSYSATVPYVTSSVTLTPTARSASIQGLTVGGAATASGSPSGAQPLAVGPNTVTVVVTAEDGTVGTYTVTVTRTAASTDSTLAVLTADNGAGGSDLLSPAFTPGVTSYTATVPLADANVKVTATAASSLAMSTLIDGAPSPSTSAVSFGARVIAVEVVAQDGSSTVYEITVVKTPAPGSDPTLADLVLGDPGVLKPTYEDGRTSYSSFVYFVVGYATLTPTARDPAVSLIRVSSTLHPAGVSVASGSSTPLMELAVGMNVFDVEVTAADTTTKMTYQVSILRRVFQTDASLLALAPSAGALAPAFTPGDLGPYAVNLVGEVSVSLTATTNATSVAELTATPAGQPALGLVSGQPSAPIALPAAGTTLVDLFVMAEDNVTTTLTQVTFTTSLSTDASLSMLETSAGALDPVFSPGVTAYTVAAAYGTDPATFTATAAQAQHSSLTVGAVAATSGQPSGDVALPTVGGAGTPVAIVCVAQDNTTTLTYTVTVVRGEPDLNVALAMLDVSPGTLDPPFAPGVTAYRVVYGVAEPSATVTATASSATSTLSMSPAAQPMTLATGLNRVLVTVTAEDGVTVRVVQVDVINPTSPDPVSPGPAGTELTPFSVKLTWSAPAFDGGSAVTSYDVMKGDGTLIAAVPAATELVLDSLVPLTNYTFRVAARNVYGASAPGPASWVMTPYPIAAISSVSPGAGPVVGGSPITITGSWLGTSAASVKVTFTLDSAPATVTNPVVPMTVVSLSADATQLVVLSPALPAPMDPVGINPGLVKVDTGHGGALATSPFSIVAAKPPVPVLLACRPKSASEIAFGFSLIDPIAAATAASNNNNNNNNNGTSTPAVTLANEVTGVEVTVRALVNGSAVPVVVATKTVVRSAFPLPAGEAEIVVPFTNLTSGSSYLFAVRSRTVAQESEAAVMSCFTPDAAAFGGNQGVVGEGAAPLVFSVSPSSGPQNGGTEVTITGAFLGASADDIQRITIAGVPCTFTKRWLSSERISCVTEASPSANFGPVSVSTWHGEHVASAVTFTYTVPPPEVIDLRPRVFTPSGGTLVVVRGLYFGDGGSGTSGGSSGSVSVLVGGSACLPVRWISGTELECATPPESPSSTVNADGSVPVVVTRNGVSSAPASSSRVSQGALFRYGAECNPPCDWNGVCVEGQCATCLDGFTNAPECDVKLVQVSEPSSLSTNEDGGSVTFSVSLGAPPSGRVVVEAFVSDTGEITAQPQTLAFEPANWEGARAVTVSGIDDGKRDGNRTVSVTFSVVEGPSAFRKAPYLPTVRLQNNDSRPVVAETPIELTPMLGHNLTLKVRNTDPVFSVFVGGIKARVLAPPAPAPAASGSGSGGGSSGSGGGGDTSTSGSGSTSSTSSSSSSSSTATAAAARSGVRGGRVSGTVSSLSPSVLQVGGTQTAAGTTVAASDQAVVREYTLEVPPKSDGKDGYATMYIENRGGAWVRITDAFYYTEVCPEPGQLGRGLDCRDCPSGAICPGGNRVWPTAGFWNAGEESGFVEACDPPEACVGGRFAECRPGHMGRNCAQCIEDHYSLGGLCTPCPESESVMTFLIADFVLWGSLAVATVVVKDRMTLSYIVMTVRAVQMVAGLGQQATGKLPSWLLSAYEVLHLFSGDYSVLKPDCMEPVPYHLMFAYSLLYNVAIFSPVFLVLPLTRWLTVRAAIKRGESADEVQARRDYFKDRIVRCFFIWLTVVYLSVTSLALQTLSCVKGGDGRWFMITHPQQECWKETGHLAVSGVSSLILLGYSVGFPCSVLYKLRSNPGRLHADERFMERYNFFYEFYNPAYPTFWIIEFPITCIVAAGKSLLKPHVNYQMSISVAIFAIKLGYIVWKRPFIDWMTDVIQAVLALVSMVAINITFFSRNGLLDSIPGMSEYLSMGMMILFGLVVVGMLGMVVYLVLFKKDVVLGALGLGKEDDDGGLGDLKLELDMEDLWSDDEEYYYEDNEEGVTFKVMKTASDWLPAVFDAPEARTRKKRVIQYNTDRREALEREVARRGTVGSEGDVFADTEEENDWFGAGIVRTMSKKMSEATAMVTGGGGSGSGDGSGDGSGNGDGDGVAKGSPGAVVGGQQPGHLDTHGSPEQQDPSQVEAGDAGEGEGGSEGGSLWSKGIDALGSIPTLQGRE